ncbi:hypothetical protein HELRODRAFT_162951 [Helobdella robusta]|uniref:Uncharacterized protein n=1 Tax=Helobdella robusta TaxID=6412 RepID=T1ETE9_HELRO|nr:hypothetical protein HELRODRAFT_162951 [Helobdella robusta]ESN99404.1 hypothetical protein HELRODRAFT_162951 [Helobdella robusta]
MAVADSLLSASLDPDMLATALDRNLHSLLDRHAPLKTITIRSGQKHIFTLSDEARQEKRECRRLERKLRLDPHHAVKHAYRFAKNTVKTAILKSRADCISSEFGKSNSNPRSLWPLLLTKPSG